MGNEGRGERGLKIGKGGKVYRMIVLNWGLRGLL